MIDGDDDATPGKRPDPAPDGRGPVRRLLRFGLHTVAIGLAALLGLGLLGRLVGDLEVPLAFLLYLPLLPIGVVALVADLAALGRALPSCRRFLLAGFGVLGIGGELVELVAGPGADDPVATTSEIKILHWNVVWGGGRNGSRWDEVRGAILDRGADVVILNEAPGIDRIESLRAGLGDEATAIVRHDALDRGRYGYGLVVASRWPTQYEEDVPLANGAGMVVRVTTPERALRILVVDGRSDPRIARAGFLRDIVAACGRWRVEGRPIDLIAGDFNCIGRNLGFGEIADCGYRLASRSCGGWRGTFPARCPLYDIDHVWVDARATGVRAEFFTDFASDHRGQVVRYHPPGAAATPPGP